MNFTLLFIILSSILSLLSGCSSGGSSGAADPVPAPGAPMAVCAVGNDGSVNLTWSSSATAAVYNVYSSSTTSIITKTTASLLTPGGVTAASFHHVSLTNGTTFYYAISAANSSGEGDLSQVVMATPAPSSSSVTISGYMLYQDKEYGVDGFTGNRPYKPIRRAPVELVSGTNVLSSTVTDQQGRFTITIPPAGSVHIRVLAQASLSGTPNINIKDLSGMLYAAGSADLILSGNANVNIAVPADPVGGAFNILDVFTNGYEFIYSLAGSYPAGVLNGFWEHDNPAGTYFCPAYDSSGCGLGAGIYVLNDPAGDTDEYDDDVLYHEFGHFTAARFSKDDSPGGYHYFTDNDLDMRLTWSEGWGDFFPGALKAAVAAELLSTASGVGPFVYVDTAGSSGWSFDFASPVPPSGDPADTFMYSTSEVAIAKILLDTRSSFGMQDIWDVITSPAFTTSSPVNLEVFWDGWLLFPKPTSTGTVTLQSIFGNRQVDYPDEVVSDNTFSTALPILAGAGQTQTLYGAGDADYFSFYTAATGTYVVNTYNLKNGADTAIAIYGPGPSYTELATNDNWMPTAWTAYTSDQVPSDYFVSLCETVYGPCHENALDKLSSRVVFSAPTGTSYIRVQSSSGRPVSAGRYGSYTVSVTTQP